MVYFSNKILMKKAAFIYFLIIIGLAISCKTNSKTTSSNNVAKDTSITAQNLPCSLPLVPEFVGGDQAMIAFINENLKYPEEAKKNNISGAVLVSFNVLVSGELTDVKVQQGIGYGCDEEAVRIVKLMPKWQPGKHLNQPIDMFYSIGIIFQNK